MPDVRVIDAGIGGDTLDGGRARYDRDVLAHNPDVVLIALGANDFWRNSRPVSVMGGDLRAMVKEARRRGMQVVVASCFGDRDFWEEVCTEFDASRFDWLNRSPAWNVRYVMIRYLYVRTRRSTSSPTGCRHADGPTIPR